MERIKKGHYKTDHGELKQVDYPIKGWIFKWDNTWFDYDVFTTRKEANDALVSLATGKPINVLG